MIISFQVNFKKIPQSLNEDLNKLVLKFLWKNIGPQVDKSKIYTYGARKGREELYTCQTPKCSTEPTIICYQGQSKLSNSLE